MKKLAIACNIECEMLFVLVVRASLKQKVFWPMAPSSKPTLAPNDSFVSLYVLFFVFCELARKFSGQRSNNECWLRMLFTSMPTRKANCEITAISKWIQVEINQTLRSDCFAIDSSYSDCTVRQRRINCWVQSIRVQDLWFHKNNQLGLWNNNSVSCIYKISAPDEDWDKRYRWTWMDCDCHAPQAIWFHSCTHTNTE